MVRLTLAEWKPPPLDPVIALGELEMKRPLGQRPVCVFTEPAIASTRPFEQDSCVNSFAADAPELTPAFSFVVLLPRIAARKSLYNTLLWLGSRSLGTSILANGSEICLYLATHAACKSLLPIYDKPMIYNPQQKFSIAFEPREKGIGINLRIGSRGEYFLPRPTRNAQRFTTRSLQPVARTACTFTLVASFKELV